MNIDFHKGGGGGGGGREKSQIKRQIHLYFLEDPPLPLGSHFDKNVWKRK